MNCIVAPPGQPDLVVTQVYGDQVNAGSLCTIFADVQNIGTATHPDDDGIPRRHLTASRWRGFNSLVATPALSPGQTTTVSFGRSYGRGQHRRRDRRRNRTGGRGPENNNANTGSGYPSTNFNCHYP